LQQGKLGFHEELVSEWNQMFEECSTNLEEKRMTSLVFLANEVLQAG